LRHTGITMAAGQGASLRELMERMGTPAPGPHSSTSTPPRSGTRPSRRAWASCYARRGARPGLRPGERARSRHRARSGRAAGNAPRRDHSETDDHALDLGRSGESGRRESNPHDQLGRLPAHRGHGLRRGSLGSRWEP
jgi:hypothetical protein